MGVNRLNPVQKATYFLKKSKVGKNEECTVTVKTVELREILGDVQRVPALLINNHRTPIADTNLHCQLRSSTW